MKKYLLVLSALLTVVGFAQDPQPSSINLASDQLEGNNLKLIMICAIPLILLSLILLALYFVSYRKNPAKKWMLFAAIAALVIGIGLCALYILVPVIVYKLAGR